MRSGAGRALPQLRARPAFVDDARVVGALVVVAEPRRGGHRLGDERRILVELIGEREEQHHERFLVRRLDLEDVEADAFGLPRLVQQPIPFGLRERPWHGLRRHRFQFELHGTSQSPCQSASQDVSGEAFNLARRP